MKVTIEIDCTPDEARQFFGLPDVKPIQEAVMGKIEAQMLDAVERFSADSMLRSWLSLAPIGAEQVRDFMDRFMKGASNK